MAFDQTYCMDTLTAATRPDADSGEFIYSFLDAYSFPKATITQVRNGGQRNVASRKNEGHVALKNWLYFMPVRQGESIHEALQVLADEDEPARHKCRFLVVTDFRELTALDTKTDERLEVGFSDLPTQYLFFAPMAGLERTKHFEEASADLKAAAKMGRLFDRLKEVNEFSTPEQLHALNVFLTRLLFCYFAEDTGIFEKNAFTKVITEASGESGEGLPDLLVQLFRVMNQPEDERPADLPVHVAQFPYVNGGLFRDTLPVPEIRGKGRRMMIECGQLAWEAVNPDIFGSMFQAVVDEESRDALGQHYTSVPNIMKVIRPLFLDKLYAELHKSKGNRKKLEALLERLTRVRIFDPAMGSGNFLIISYKELRRLEMAVFRELQEVSGQQEMFMSGIQISQFYGIEIDDFAHEVSQLSMWLAEHQMNTLFSFEFGHSKPLLPLRDLNSLVRCNSLKVEWGDIFPSGECSEIYICGNPPFVGGKRLSKDQSSDMDFVGLGKKKQLDYVSCWFVKASEFIKKSGGSFAFVATSSLCQGEQVSLLWPMLFNIGQEIFFAYTSFRWANNSRDKAGVYCVIVGVRAKQEGDKVIYSDGYVRNVKSISPYLTEGGGLSVESRRAPLSSLPKMCMGSNPVDGKNLILTEEEYFAALDSEPGIDKYLKQYMGGDDFLRGKRRYCIWIEDAKVSEARKFSFIDKRLALCEEYRRNGGRDAKKVADQPHRFCYRTYQETPSVIVPKTSSSQRIYVPCGMVLESVVINVDAFSIYGADMFVFGMLSSKMHNVWLATTSGRLGEGYRYSTKLTYNTFPLPYITELEKEHISLLGRKVFLARAQHPEKSIVQLYDPDKMPENLLEAHQALDRAVEKLYRDRPFRDTAERQEYLLARYEELIEAEKAAKAGGKKKTRKATTTEG